MRRRMNVLAPAGRNEVWRAPLRRRDVVDAISGSYGLVVSDSSAAGRLSRDA